MILNLTKKFSSIEYKLLFRVCPLCKVKTDFMTVFGFPLKRYDFNIYADNINEFKNIVDKYRLLF